MLFVTAGQAPQEAAKTPSALLQGNWAVATFNGEAVPVEAEAYLVFTGDKYEQWTGSNVDERGTVKIDASKKPMAIDLIIVEGSDAGKTQLGVFELAGDTLTVTLATPGDTSCASRAWKTTPRAKSFKSCGRARSTLGRSARPTGQPDSRSDPSQWPDASGCRAGHED